MTLAAAHIQRPAKFLPTITVFHVTWPSLLESVFPARSSRESAATTTQSATESTMCHPSTRVASDLEPSRRPGSLKLNGRLASYSPLSRVVELEACRPP